MKRHIAERTNKADIRPEEQRENGELTGEFLRRNSVERAIKTETEVKRRKKKGVGMLCWFMSKK